MFQKAIAIDGPSGAGKSTVARLIAAKLGFRYIDTGAMYRVCTLNAIRMSVDINDEAAVSGLMDTLDICLGEKDGLPLIFLNGENVSEAIRGTEVTSKVSVVCKYPAVRSRMVELQRRFADAGGVVMDGRDIGTNVLPRALLKVFLTASAEERGHRRFIEWREKGIGTEMTEAEVIEDLKRRDYLDSTRELNPLCQAGDAILLDSTALTPDAVVAKIIRLWEEKIAHVI